MLSVFKTTVPYMVDLELCSACGSPLQLGVVLVKMDYLGFKYPSSNYTSRKNDKPL